MTRENKFDLPEFLRRFAAFGSVIVFFASLVAMLIFGATILILITTGVSALYIMSMYLAEYIFMKYYSLPANNIPRPPEKPVAQESQKA